MGKLLSLSSYFDHEHFCPCGTRFECEMGKWCDGEVNELCLDCAMKSLEEDEHAARS